MYSGYQIVGSVIFGACVGLVIAIVLKEIGDWFDHHD